MANVKVFKDKQMDRPKTICPRSIDNGGIKIVGKGGSVSYQHFHHIVFKSPILWGLQNLGFSDKEISTTREIYSFTVVLCQLENLTGPYMSQKKRKKLTLSQTTNFRVVQIERGCRRQF